MNKDKLLAMNEAHSDHGTVIKNDETALVFSPTDGIYFLAPDLHDDEAIMGGAEMFLAACFMRSADEDWLHEMMTWLKRQSDEHAHKHANDQN